MLLFTVSCANYNLLEDQKNANNDIISMRCEIVLFDLIKPQRKVNL